MGISNDNHHKNNGTDDVSSANEKNEDSITLNKSVFYKIVVLGVIALMISAFFAGYTVHDFLSPVTYITIPSAKQNPDFASPASSTLPHPIPTTVENITIDDAPIMGRTEAKVKVVEYSDFQCPFCESFFINTFSQLKKNYVDTGKIQFVFKHFPLDYHLNAMSAAMASECAKEQRKFWGYHDTLFGNQISWDNTIGNQTTDIFVKYAFDLGLDVRSFKLCFDSKKYEGHVDNDLQQGLTIGVTGTPTFFIGNDAINYTYVEGSQPIASFKQIIDQKLSP